MHFHISHHIFSGLFFLGHRVDLPAAFANSQWPALQRMAEDDTCKLAGKPEIKRIAKL